MYNLSNHTVQINGWIILTQDSDYISDNLSELEFAVDLIEYAIGEEGNVKPDIVLTSPVDDYSIVVDCKSNKITNEQTRKYKGLEENPGDLLEEIRLDGEIDSSEYGLETCYSSLSDLSGNLIFSTYDIAFVHFEHSSSGVFITNPHQFNNQDVASTFPINMNPDRELPTEYYPFDIEQVADYKEFVSFLIQALISHAAKDETFDIEETLQWAHPYWEHIGSDKREQFIREGKKVMQKLESEDLSQYIQNIADSDSEYVVHHQTANAIQERIEDPKFISRVAQEVYQETLP